MIMAWIAEAVAAGAREEKVCEVLGLSVRTTQRWKLDPDGDDGREGPHTRPANALSDAERQRALSELHRPEHHDASPKTIVAKLADRGEYVASESTMYRLLRAAGELTHRGLAKAPVHREGIRCSSPMAVSVARCWEPRRHAYPDGPPGPLQVLSPSDP
jgi:putative transposase